MPPTEQIGTVLGRSFKLTLTLPSGVPALLLLLAELLGMLAALSAGLFAIVLTVPALSTTGVVVEVVPGAVPVDVDAAVPLAVSVDVLVIELVFLFVDVPAAVLVSVPVPVLVLVFVPVPVLVLVLVLVLVAVEFLSVLPLSESLSGFCEHAESITNTAEAITHSFDCNLYFKTCSPVKILFDDGG